MVPETYHRCVYAVLSCNNCNCKFCRTGDPENDPPWKASVNGVPRHVLYYRYNDIFIQIWYIIFQKEKSESDEENQTTGEGKDMTTMNRILDLTIKLTASALFISKVEESFNCVRLFKGKPIRENCVIEIAGETYT